MGILALVFSLTGCSLLRTLVRGERGHRGAGMFAKVNESGTVAFSYRYSGSIGGDSYSYDVKTLDDGSTVFECEYMQHPDYGIMSLPVEKEVLDQLNGLYLEHKLARWDGYDRYATNVLDGDGFGISYGFADGGRMSASGTNAYPEGYSSFVHDMKEILDPYAETACEEAREKQIAQGVEGDPDFLLLNFIQHGSSGADEYYFLISKQGVRTVSFDVRITSKSGEFFPEGSLRYYEDLPDEAIWFDRIGELAEKYELINWYDWDRSAEDYDNTEWFQMSMYFGERCISACGTAHPENYDGFRKEFLMLMAEMIDNAKAEYGMSEQ